jgi:hypothetical protein
MASGTFRNCARDAQILVEHQQGLADGVDDRLGERMTFIECHAAL